MSYGLSPRTRCTCDRRPGRTAGACPPGRAHGPRSTSPSRRRSRSSSGRGSPWCGRGTRCTGARPATRTPRPRKSIAFALRRARGEGAQRGFQRQPAAGEGSAPAWRQFPELKLWDLRDLTLEDRIKLIFHCLMLYSQWFEVDQLEELFED